MPTFPTYRGELPECLNPLNPRHYFLLFYWVFFRPTALKSYLYQAAPELYCSKMKMGILQTWYALSYRNLFFMMPSASVLLSVFLALPYTLFTGWILSISIDWLKWIPGVVGGATFGVVIGVASGIVVSLVFGVAVGVAVGVIVGIMGGMANGIVFGVILGTTSGGIAFGMTSGIAFGVVVGIIVGVGVGIIFSVEFNVVSGIASGIAVGMTFGVIAGITSGVAAGISTTISNVGTFDMAFGVKGGALVGVAVGLAFGEVGGVVGSLAGGVSAGIAFSLISSMFFSMTTSITVGGGTLRIFFYPFHLALALCSRLRGVRHPIEWDELIMFPLPYTRQILSEKLREDEEKNLQFLIIAAQNPFQRWVVQAVLYRYLHTHKIPLRFLYVLLTHPELDEYIVAPMRNRDWEQNTNLHHLFLGELALQFVGTTWDISITFFEWLVWWMSYPLRKHQHTPLTRFAKMLYNLLCEKTIEAKEFNLSLYSKVYNDLSIYPDGEEISQTFDAMAACLSYNSLSNLTAAPGISSGLSFDDPIRPTVLTTLKRLGEVGAEVKTYQDSSSRANRMAALARATDALKKLDEYVQVEVMAPEQYLLRRIIRQWQDLLISAGGELGRAVEIGPVVNPYIAGNPVTGELFVGREDILRRLEELWSGDGQKPSIVLYGHRRMGKSSILHNLGTRFGQNTEIIDFNMQRAGLVSSTGELLYNLALAIYDALPTPHPSQEGNRSFSEPEEKNFLEHNPYTAFDRFLKQVGRIRGEKRFIIAIDEFEMIEQKIQQGKLEPLLLDFWRGLIQTYPWVIMAFAGLHTLQEMTQDYWNPLFGSVTGIPVSFLKENAAKRLITQPTADFALDYDQDAVSEIVRLTYGQPYLVQLICHCLVSHFNRQTFEEGVERERRFHRSDVEAVIAAPEFFRDGEAYFSGVWQQTRHADAPEAGAILKVLAQAEAGLSLAELVKQSGLALEQAQQSLKFLQRHDLATETEGAWTFTVELMRRWVLRSQQ